MVWCGPTSTVASRATVGEGSNTGWDCCPLLIGITHHKKHNVCTLKSTCITSPHTPLSPRCQPAQLWGVLWGFAQCGSPPDEPWLASWLAAAQQQLDGFNAEGLAHLIWALAAVGHVPHKLWLRAFCGMVAFKIK